MFVFFQNYFLNWTANANSFVRVGLMKPILYQMCPEELEKVRSILSHAHGCFAIRARKWKIVPPYRKPGRENDSYSMNRDGMEAPPCMITLPLLGHFELKELRKSWFFILMMVRINYLGMYRNLCRTWLVEYVGNSKVSISLDDDMMMSMTNSTTNNKSTTLDDLDDSFSDDYSDLPPPKCWDSFEAAEKFPNLGKCGYARGVNNERCGGEASLFGAVEGSSAGRRRKG
jgi:hypothetical protein